MTPPPWTYRCRFGAEIGTPGSPPVGVVRPHFHDEIQLAVVTAGRRTFVVAGARVDVAAGFVLVVPPRAAHCTVADDGRWRGFNVYLAPRALPLPRDTAMVLALPAGPPAADPAFCDPLAGDALCALRAGVLAAAERGGAIAMPCATDPGPAGGEPGPSRPETAIRRFKRRTGITPHAAAQSRRLNRARRLLREGMPPADVAAALGFADQSHLTRQFRAAFGTTPGRYGGSAAAGWPAPRRG